MNNIKKLQRCTLLICTNAFVVYGISIWTGIIALSLFYNIHSSDMMIKQIVKNEAMANFNKDLAFRLWATSHGGCYVPITDKTTPNPHLSHVPERDITTPSGQRLTLMNPAYMLKQMMTDYSDLYGIKGRITSLKPLNPTNSPDEWEAKALRQFEKGTTEVSEFTEINDQPYYRYMRPFVATKDCLKCHAHQGYKEGDIRGGIGVSVPMKPYLDIQRTSIINVSIAHAVVWLCGVIAVVLLYHKARYQELKRIEAEEALKKSIEELNRAQEVAKTGSWFIDIPKNELRWSLETFRIFGMPYTDAPLTYETFLSLVYDEDRQYVDESWKAALEGKEYEIEHRILANGVVKWVEERAKIIFDEQGNPASGIGTVRDITERKEFETKQAQIIQDLERMRIASLNIMEDLQHEVLIRKKTEEELKQKTAELEELTKKLDLRVREEIKARLEKEQILVHQSRLAAMGEMIGAIAHQWRQPLNALSLIIQDLKDAHEFGELDRDYIFNAVQNALKYINFMSKTIDDFRSFFRRDKEATTFDVKLAVADVLSMLSAHLKANHISYRLTCHEHNKSFEDFTDVVICDAFIITGYQNELKQVFLNIISNAKDAIAEARERGLLQPSDKGMITFDFYKKDDEIIIQIRDNAGGIPEDIIDRIFDPYFTTKGQGKGTGIGLYMSKMIIEKNMGGKLTANNIKGGAEFRILLPLTPPPPENVTIIQ